MMATTRGTDELGESEGGGPWDGPGLTFSISGTVLEQ